MTSATLCPSCGYELGISSGARCPECGADVGHWTTRWKPWYLLTGLDLLAFGIPLLFVSVVVAYLLQQRHTIAILNILTLHAASVPVLLCLVGGWFVITADGTLRTVARRAYGLLTLATLGCMAAALHSTLARNWLPLDHPYMALWPHVTGAVVAVAFMSGLIALASMVAGSLVRLDHEWGSRLARCAAVGVVIMALSLAAVIVGDAWTVLTRQTKPAALPPSGPVVLRSHPMAAEVDPYSRGAAIIGIVLFWAAVLAVRARVRWEVRLAPNSAKPGTTPIDAVHARSSRR